jgi:hypothetical protein
LEERTYDEYGHLLAASCIPEFSELSALRFSETAANLNLYKTAGHYIPKRKIMFSGSLVPFGPK